MTLKVNVEMTDQFGPYLRPNQFVNYTKSTKVVKKAASITKNCKNDLAKVKKVYNYVIKNYKYDKKLAKTVKPGYVPNLNKIYKKKKGICGSNDCDAAKSGSSDKTNCRLYRECVSCMDKCVFQEKRTHFQNDLF